MAIHPGCEPFICKLFGLLVLQSNSFDTVCLACKTVWLSSNTGQVSIRFACYVLKYVRTKTHNVFLTSPMRGRGSSTHCVCVSVCVCVCQSVTVLAGAAGT